MKPLLLQLSQPCHHGSAVAVREHPLRLRRADVRKRMNVRGPAGRCLQSMSIGGSETPAFRCGGWGEPQPFGRELQQLGADAGKRYSPPQRTFAHPFVSRLS